MTAVEELKAELAGQFSILRTLGTGSVATARLLGVITGQRADTHCPDGAPPRLTA